MNNSEAKEALFQLLDHLLEEMPRSGYDFSQADVDEIKYLTNVSRELLPEMFVVIAESYKFGGTQSGAHAFLERLNRVRAISEKFPQPKISQSGGELVPTFSLPEKDKLRIQELCGDMRKIIYASEVFDQPHKIRLLNRIASIEEQIYQEIGIFDIVRGGMNDLGETLGKFGTDIKPLTDRMREVVGIARKNTKDYDQLPAPEEIKQLPAPEPEDNSESE